MANYNFDVVYQGLNQSIMNTEKCSFVIPEDEETVKELIDMADIVIKNLRKLEIKEE